MESQQHVTDMGGTMRLGSYPARLKPGSLVADMYGASDVSERHRHRYEFSNAYREVFERHGVRFSGLSPDGSLVELIEIPDHPWFVGCQFHPELRSRPTRPHPLFAGFIGAAVRASQGRADERERSQRAHAAG
jgi:CTP synthase